jgi:hypothetical protein
MLLERVDDILLTYYFSAKSGRIPCNWGIEGLLTMQQLKLVSDIIKCFLEVTMELWKKKKIISLDFGVIIAFSVKILLDSL